MTNAYTLAQVKTYSNRCKELLEGLTRENDPAKLEIGLCAALASKFPISLTGDHERCYLFTRHMMQNRLKYYCWVASDGYLDEHRSNFLTFLAVIPPKDLLEMLNNGTWQ